jgi:hypothetical protein
MGGIAQAESKIKGPVPEYEDDDRPRIPLVEILDDRIKTLEKICQSEVNRIAMQTLELNRYIKSKLR